MSDFAALLRLSPEALTRPCDPKQFRFASTDELEPFRGVLGQERAVEALQFGVAMPRPGYNLFVMGEPGTGRFSLLLLYTSAFSKMAFWFTRTLPPNRMGSRLTALRISWYVTSPLT